VTSNKHVDDISESQLNCDRACAVRVGMKKSYFPVMTAASLCDCEYTHICRDFVFG